MDDFIGTLISWLAIFAFVWGLFAYFEIFSAKDTLRVYQYIKQKTEPLPYLVKFFLNLTRKRSANIK